MNEIKKPDTLKANFHSLEGDYPSETSITVDFTTLYLRMFVYTTVIDSKIALKITSESI